MKIKALSVFLIISPLSIQLFAQLPPVTLPRDKGTMYFLAGFNRNWFAKSDIRFTGSNYDFTLRNVKAHDLHEIGKVSGWEDNTPQFNFRAGYIFKGEAMVGIEAGVDHVKYVATESQVVHMSGIINGEVVEKDTVMTNDNLAYRHSNGSNFVMLSFVKIFPIVSSEKDMHSLFALVKPGGGIEIPRTVVQMFGTGQSNDYHLAGYVIGLEASLRYVAARHYIIETGGKGRYTSMNDVLTINGDRASQTYLSFEWIVSIGYLFRL